MRDLLDAVRSIFENESGDHGEDGDYGDYDEDSFDIYFRKMADESLQENK